MAKDVRPGIDRSIAPEHGVSRDGQPLSYNRGPSVDLEPWIGRLYVTRVQMPTGYRLQCGLFNDVASIRILMAGDWSARTADGEVGRNKGVMFFGPHTRHMPIGVTGSFVSIGLTIRPGACTALDGPRIADYRDRVVDSDEVGCPSAPVLAMLDGEAEPETLAQALEGLVRKRVEQAGWRKPDPAIARFEIAALRDPSFSIAEFAQACGIERRTLERIIKRDFGLSPKQVLRRARALDMASHLRGVADGDESEELLLRYYDESHLIREFTELFGMSPRKFVETPQPILTLTLEARQARRLEMLNRIEPGATRPWQ